MSYYAGFVKMNVEASYEKMFDDLGLRGPNGVETYGQMLNELVFDPKTTERAFVVSLDEYTDCPFNYVALTEGEDNLYNTDWNIDDIDAGTREEYNRWADLQRKQRSDGLTFRQREAAWEDRLRKAAEIKAYTMLEAEQAEYEKAKAMLPLRGRIESNIEATKEALALADNAVITIRTEINELAAKMAKCNALLDSACNSRAKLKENLDSSELDLALLKKHKLT